ncbi:MAG: YceI family protein [Terriglobia bacterium]
MFAGLGVALGSTSTFTVLSVCLGALSAAASLQAKNLVITLDPAETKIAFALSATLHAVHGTFHMQSGHIAFDPSMHAISGDIIVGAASGDSGNAVRDRRMRRDVLQVRRYPEVRFSPTAWSGAVVRNGISRIKVTGLLMIHGKARRITIPMEVQMSHEKITATGTFIVPYVKWGMKNPSMFFLRVSKNVEIDITAVGQIRQTDAK